MLLVIALSMLLTPLLFIAYERLRARMGGPAETAEPTRSTPARSSSPGSGGSGSRQPAGAGLGLQDTWCWITTWKTIQLMRRFGFKGFFGDPTRPELLQAAGLKRRGAGGGASTTASGRPTGALCPPRAARSAHRRPRP
jgi:CPA2 family monovalent cation:H+ antiporter-2